MEPSYARNDDGEIPEATAKLSSEDQGAPGVAEPSSKKRKTSTSSEDSGDDDKDTKDSEKDSGEPSNAGRNWRRVMANRRSARESRERRKKRMDVLEKAVEALTTENAEVVRENRSLQHQIFSLLPHVDMASYRRQQQHDLSMMAAASASQFVPMGGIGGLGVGLGGVGLGGAGMGGAGLGGAGMGLPQSLPSTAGFHLNGIPRMPNNHLNRQSLAMSQQNLGSAAYYEQEELANLQAVQKSRGRHFLP
jgi:hypothetical protein